MDHSIEEQGNLLEVSRLDARHYASPGPRRSLTPVATHEAAEGERDWMLNLSQAREVVVQCITKWLRDSGDSRHES